MREDLDIEEVLQTEEMVVYEMIDNKDGSITVEAWINVYTTMGTFSTYRKMRLWRKKREK